MDADKIKVALKKIHNTERSVLRPDGPTRVQAIEAYFKAGHTLSHGEVDVLLRALSVSRTELLRQW